MNEVKINKAVTLTDIEGLVALLSDDKLQKSVNLMLPTNKKDRLLALTIFIKRNHVALLKMDNNVVGMIVLTNWYGQEGQKIAHHYEIGYLLRRNLWGQGIMTKMMKEIIASLPAGIVLHAQCKEDNYRSQRVLAKCGFIYEKDLLWRLVTQ